MPEVQEGKGVEWQEYKGEEEGGVRSVRGEMGQCYHEGEGERGIEYENTAV